MATRTGSQGSKAYDRAYFERWYRGTRGVVIRDGLLERRVALAVAATEYLTEERVRSVLDVGCGEGSWRPILRQLRPGVRYVGVDSSAYAVSRFGRRRNLRLGNLGELDRLRLGRPFDLVVCSDVLHYVQDAELGRGLRAIARLTGGAAFLEFYTREDATEGDDEGFVPRTAAQYRRVLRAAGLRHAGMHCYVGPRFTRAGGVLTSFERGWGA